MKKIVFTIIFMVLLSTGVAFADEITLNDGQVISGTTTEIKGDLLRVSTSQGMVDIKIDKLQKVVLRNRYVLDSFQDVDIDEARLKEWIKANELNRLVTHIEKEREAFRKKFGTFPNVPGSEIKRLGKQNNSKIEI